MLDVTASLPLKDAELFRQANCIDGKWVQADSGRTLAVRNPATGDVIDPVPAMGVAETRRAIEAAHAADLPSDVSDLRSQIAADARECRLYFLEGRFRARIIPEQPLVQTEPVVEINPMPTWLWPGLPNLPSLVRAKNATKRWRDRLLM